MGVQIKSGNNSAGLANVSSTYDLQVNAPMDVVNAGFLASASEVDAGDVTGTRLILADDISDDYRLRVGVDQTVFNATFEGSLVHTPTYYQLLTTMTVTQANGFMQLNAAASTASAAAYVRTHRHFSTFGTYPTYVDMWIRESSHTATNAISEWGFLYVTSQGTQQPIDGVFFRRISGGQLKGVITNNSVDIAEVTIDTTNVPPRDGTGAFDPTETNHYLIAFHNDVVRFWINDTLVGSLDCPSAQAQFAASSSLPVAFRVINTSTASAGRQLSVGYINVATADQNTSKPWSHVMAGSNNGAHVLPVGNTVGPTVTRGAAPAGWVTSATARAAGTWTATSAPATNSLGGMWVSPAISTLTSDADYPVFQFLNPIGTASVPGKTLYITGIRVGESVVTTVASTNSIVLTFILGIGAFNAGSAPTTATADAATTVAPKGMVIGQHGFGSTDAVGTMKQGFEMKFDTPLVIPAGHYIQFIVRPFGTVTSNTLVVCGTVAFNGYFE